MRSHSLFAKGQPLGLPDVLQISILTVAHQVASDIAIVGDKCRQDKWISANVEGTSASLNDLAYPAATMSSRLV